MGFDLGSALAVRERSDGLLEKDTFDLGSAQPAENIQDPGIMEKVLSNPAVGEALKVITGGLTKKEADQFTIDIMQPLVSAGESGVKAITKPGLMETPLEIGKGTIEMGKFVLNVMSRPVQAATAGIGAAVDKKPVEDILQLSFRGYMKPEEVKSLTERIPFQPWEQGSWTHLIPRATVDAIESYLTATLVYGNIPGKIKAAYDASKVEGAAQEMDKIATQASEYIVKNPDKFNIRFPGDWNEADKLGMTKVFIQNKLGATPKVGEALMQRQSMLNKFKEFISSERGSVIIPKVGDPINWKGQIGKITEIDGERVIIALGKSEVVATLSQLSLPEVVIDKLAPGKPTKEFGFTDQGLYEKVIDLPVADIEKRSISTPEYRDEDVVAVKGRKVTKPIIVTIENINDPESPIEVVDGWHRYRQALANGDKTIPVKLIYKPNDIEPLTAKDFNQEKAPLAESDIKMNPAAIDKANEIQQALGKRLVISSGYRTEEYNKDLMKRGYKADPKSVHLSGNAFDIDFKKSGLTQQEVVDAAFKAGVNVEDITLTPKHVHVEIPTEGSPTKLMNPPAKPPEKPPVTEGEPQPPQDPLQKLINALKEAKPVRAETEALMRAERGKRIMKAKAIGEKVKGEAGYRARLGSLKGELPKAQFESLRGQITQADIDNIFDRVSKFDINEWDKLTAMSGLAKIFGEMGGQIPTEGELKILNKILGNDLIEALLKNRTLLQKFMYASGQLLNVPRSVMASFDVSAPLRQGAFFIGRKEFYPAFRDMFSFFAKEENLTALNEEIASRPTYELMKEYGLALTDLESGLTNREERFMSNWAENIPLAGIAIRASSRAYVGFLNKLRADVFDNLLNAAKESGVKVNDKFYTDLVDFINAATGRGKLPGVLNNTAVALNSVFFSPRLMASRIELLNPAFYITKSPFIRKEALKSLLTFSGVAFTILSLAALAGLEVGKDIRSSDFAKIKIGNTRIDIMAGFQQYLRMAGQLISGEYVSSVSGKVMTLGEGYKPLTRYDILLKQLENKEAPVASFITALLRQKTFMGEDVNVGTEIASRFTPMVLGDMVELAQTAPELLPLGLLGLFGVGLQSYENKSSRSSSVRSSSSTKKRSSSTK